MMTCPLTGVERIMSIESLVRHLSVVEDPRCQGKIEHRLIDILVIAVCAVIACAESWDDIALYGRSKLAGLRTFLDLPNGIPSHDTFRRVFMLIDPDAFERGFAAWVGSLVDGFEREVVAIDGKTLRRSFDRRRERSPLHLVSAWASEQGLVLGQRRVHEAVGRVDRRTKRGRPERRPKSREETPKKGCNTERNVRCCGAPFMLRRTIGEEGRLSRRRWCSD